MDAHIATLALASKYDVILGLLWLVANTACLGHLHLFRRLSLEIYGNDDVTGDGKFITWLVNEDQLFFPKGSLFMTELSVI